MYEASAKIAKRERNLENKGNKMQFDLLLESAVARASERGSIRQAALKVGITDVSLGQFIRWRKTNSFPSDETVFKLAEIANVDKIKSHFATMAVKIKDPELSKAYEALAQNLSGKNVSASLKCHIAHQFSNVT